MKKAKITVRVEHSTVEVHLPKKVVRDGIQLEGEVRSIVAYKEMKRLLNDIHDNYGFLHDDHWRDLQDLMEYLGKFEQP